MITPFIIDDADLDKSQAERVAAYNRNKFISNANEWVVRAAEGIVREAASHGVEVDPIAWLKNPNFDLKQAGRGLRESRRLHESVVTSMLYSLANVATTASAASMYKLTPTVYRSLCEIVASKKSEETYFVMQRGDIPQMVTETQKAADSRVGGILTRIKNYKFMRIWAVSKDLEADDQTGQIAQMGQLIGEGMAYAEELYALVVFFNAYVAANIRPGGGAGVPGSGIIPPRCIAGQNPSDGGPTTTAGDITLTNAEVALQAFDYITDILGNYALVQPDSLLVAGSRRINARKIFGSAYNPGGYSTLAATGGQAGIAGVGVMAINPLNGELAIHHSPFVNKAVSGGVGLDSANPPWAMGCAGRGWAFQDREPLEVLQEAENAGESFRSDTRNIRAKRRFGCGVKAGEFFFRGN